MKNLISYEHIKSIVEKDRAKDRVAQMLGCSRRTINRYIAGYKSQGKSYFTHGNSGRKSVNAFNEDFKRKIHNLYQTKYHGANFSHFNDILRRYENIYISESALRKILSDLHVQSPKARKGICNSSIHPTKPRSGSFGELILIDASKFKWFGDNCCVLHVAIDDATGTVVGAYFCETECLNGYYNVIKQILMTYGIPQKLSTDRRAVYQYRKSLHKDIVNDSFTQLCYACKQLGIQVNSIVAAQSQGRVERLIQTLKSRLPVEFRLHGVKSISQGNEVLHTLIDHHNDKFATSPQLIPGSFAASPHKNVVDLILAVISSRTVDNGHSIRYKNQYFKIFDRNGEAVFLKKGTMGLVIETFCNMLLFSTCYGVFTMLKIPRNNSVSTSNTPKLPQYISNLIPYPPWNPDAFSDFVVKNSPGTNIAA